MPEGDSYVRDGDLLRCDKGVLVTPLTVLPRPSRVHGRFQATTIDCLPIVNVKPFGACAITHGPCMPPMLVWTQAHPAGRLVGGAPPLLESSVCQCALGGRISITVLPVPGTPNAGTGGAGLEAEGTALARQEAARQQAQDDEAHALSGHLKEASGGLAIFGLVCLAAGLVFPPAAVVGAVALELSEAALVAGVAVDVAVAIDHPTQDNWVTVGGDALAIATGYVVGKVIIGPALSALARKLAQREALAAEAAAAKAAADKLAAEQAAAKAAADKLAAEQAAAKAAADKLAAEQAAAKAAADKLAAERAAAKAEAEKTATIKERNYYRSTKGEVNRNKLDNHEYEQAIEVVEFKGGKFEGQQVKDLEGIDGHLNGKPVSLKEYSGNSPMGVLKHVSRSETQIKNAGIEGADIYVNAKNLPSETVIDYAQKGALKDIPTQGVVDNVYIQTSDGWVHIGQNVLTKVK